jgi:hypothetical protein
MAVEAPQPAALMQATKIFPTGLLVKMADGSLL